MPYTKTPRRGSDPVLRRWGKAIYLERRRRQPDGTVRASALDGNMSQQHLADLMDPPVHQSTIDRWEAGISEPRREYKLQLAAIFDMDPDTLFPLPEAS